MYVPYDEKLKIIPQDDNFLEKEPWDFRNTTIRCCSFTIRSTSTANE
jgi:trehalose/maltose hydrolase-like predicted phosphorylase